MIFEKSDSLLRYAAAIPQLAIADRIIRSGELETLSPGRYETEDPSIWYSVQEYEAQERKDNLFEFHEKAMDVQVMIRGEEKCFYTDKAADFSLIDQSKGDIALVEAEEAEECLLKAGMAVIYFAGELHKPGVRSRAGVNRKVVFKIIL